MKVKCIKECIMNQGGYKFILNKTYKAIDSDDFILVVIPRRGYVKVPKSEFDKYFEVISP